MGSRLSIITLLTFIPALAKVSAKSLTCWGVPAFKILPLDYLTQDAYWFMFDSSRKGDKYGFQFVESEGAKLDAPNIIYKTKEIQFSATSIFDLGHNDVARM